MPLTQAALERARQIFEASPAALLVVGPGGIIEDANSIAGQMLGRPVPELIGLPAEQVFAADQRASFGQLHAQFMQLAKQHSRLGGHDTVALRADGSEFPVEIGMAPLGTTICATVIVSLQDISERENAQRVLSESEMRWRQMANSLPQLVWTCTPEGLCDFLSLQWVRYTGVPEALQLGQGWLNQVHKDDRSALIARWQQSVQQGSSFRVEFRLRRHDGAWRWFDTRAEPVLDEAGRVLRWVGSNTDIEDRKQAVAEIERLNASLEQRLDTLTAAIRQSERDMRAILDHTPSMMGYWDAQLRNRFANRAYHSWFGIDPERMPGMHIRDVIGEARYQANLPYIEGALRGEEQQFERAIATPDGSALRHSQALYQPDVDEHGKVKGFYVTVTDVTPIKLAQAHAEELLRFNDAIIANSPVGICVFAPDGPCVIANAAMAALTGASIEQVKAVNFKHLPSWQGTPLLSMAASTLSDGMSRQLEVETTSSFGKRLHASVSLSRVDRDGQPHLLLMAQDMTARQQALDELVAARDAAREASNTKSAFLANMSHEIRTPMNAIVGLSRLALEDQLPPPSRLYIDKVHSSALALMGILDEVLDYSKIEARQMRVESIPVDLHDVLARVADLFCGRIDQKGLTLTTQMAPDVPRWVMSDPLRLTQIINNLVGNAIKFTDHGGVRLHVQHIEPPGNSPNPGRLLRISVADTGIGIAKAAQDRLFDAFTQADYSITRRYGGSGLGLAICRSLVSLMGGQIGVNSQLGVISVSVQKVPPRGRW